MEKQTKLKQLAGPASGNDATRANKGAHVFVADLSKGANIPYELGDDRAAWVHAVRREIDVNGVSLKASDAVAVSGENRVLTATGLQSNEILLFDLS